MCILNCADDNPSSISIALIPALSENTEGKIPALSENTESKSLAIRDKFSVIFQKSCELIGDSFTQRCFKVDLHFNWNVLMTGTLKLFVCVFKWQMTHISSWQTILDFKKLFSIDWNRCRVQPCVSSSSCAVAKRQKGPELRLWNYKCALWSSGRFLLPF